MTVVVFCDHCEHKIDAHFPAGVNISIGARFGYRFHLCDLCMTQFEERCIQPFLTTEPKRIKPKQSDDRQSPSP